MSVSTEAARGRSASSVWMRVLIPVLIIAIGLGVLIYPVVATQWNNAKQSEVSRQYGERNKQVDPATLQAHLEEARRYNETSVAGPILDPWLSRVSEDNVDYQEYLDVLAYQQAMGRLVVPKAKADLPIYHGTSDETLNKGVGHLYGSDLPVGGEGTHSLLTAHTGLSNATLFDNLDDVVVGDTFYISVAGETIKYEVNTIDVVLPHETDSLVPVAGEDLVTLITCAPYGINTHRLLVTGHRVAMDPAEESSVMENTGFHWQWWMYALAAASLVVLVLLLIWVRRMLRKTKATTTTEAQEESL